jgi:hypothetical protein
LNDRSRISRREFLRGGGTLVLATGAAALLPLSGGGGLDKGTLDSGVMGKCISLGGPGPLREDAHPDDYRLWGNREYIEASGTKWVKFWVSWLDLQGELAAAPESLERSWEQLNGAPGGEGWLRRLDRQVRAANEDGVAVIVTLFHAFPSWAGGATGPDPVSSRKPAEQCVPRDLTPNGPWAWFVGHLCARYRKGAPRNEDGPRRSGGDVKAGNPEGAWIDALEICNEPNLLFWPQEGIERAVAGMIQTAERTSGLLGGPAILAPGTSDFPDRDHGNARGLVATNWRTFTGAVLDELRGFRPTVPVYWSHHNFQDVKHRDVPSRAERVVDLLRSRGWLTQVRPLWLTEGGYDMFPDQHQPEARARQANLIETNFERMVQAGSIYLCTQHTITDKLGNDFKSGLRDDFVPGKGPGRPRPSWHTWTRM